MQRAKTILSYLLIALVLSLSVKVQGNVVSGSTPAERDWSQSYFSEYNGINSLYLQPTDKSVSAPLSVIDFRANFSLRRAISLLSTPHYVTSVSVARELSLKVCRVAYVIYPFHDFP